MSRRINIKTTPSGEEEIRISTSNECICERPNTKVFCRHCGFFLEDSRIRAVCKVHPQTFYLLDMDTCPGCNSTGKMQEVQPYHPSPQLDWMDQAVLKRESLGPLDSPSPVSPPDTNKNFYKRSGEIKLPVLATLSANANRGAASYRYGRNHNARSYIKQK